MAADGAGRPVPLDHKISEGVAISRRTPKIAWSNTHGQYPELIAEGESVLYTADVVREGGTPRLVNKKEIMRAKAPECTLEAQDFRHEDRELIYTCYRSPFADVFGVDLQSVRQPPAPFRERRGIEEYASVDDGAIPVHVEHAPDGGRLVRLRDIQSAFVG